MAKRDDENPETPPSIDPWAVLNRLAQAMESLKSAPSSAQSEELMIRLSTALERVSESQVEGAKIIASETRRAHRPSNEVIPGISVFNRRGTLISEDDPGPRKSPLKCPMLIPWLVEWESMTREEVELLNLLQPGDYNLSLIDKSKVRIQVKIDLKVDGKTPSRLLMYNVGVDGQPGTAFNNDNYRLSPPLSDTLRQILKQHDKPIAAQSRAVLTDEEEEALIEAGELSVSA